MTKVRRFVLYSALLAVLAMALPVGYVLLWNPPMNIATAQDADEAADLLSRLIAACPALQTASGQDSPKVGCNFTGVTLDLSVYGVIDEIEQDDICSQFRTIRPQVTSKPATLRFFREEVMHEEVLQESPRVVHRWRGEEELLGDCRSE